VRSDSLGNKSPIWVQNVNKGADFVNYFFFQNIVAIVVVASAVLDVAIAAAAAAAALLDVSNIVLFLLL
jgi:hypothetical protein